MKIKTKFTSMKNWNVATKICLAIAAIAILTLGSLTYSSMSQAKTALDKATFGEVTAIAQKNAIEFEDNISEPINSAINFAEHFIENYDNNAQATFNSQALSGKRLSQANAYLENYFMAMAAKIVDNNELVTGFSLFLEPYVLGNDFPYYRIQTYNDVPEINNHEMPADHFSDEQYAMAKSTKDVYLSEPISPDGLVLIVAYYPIYEGNTFLGCVQIGYNLAYFNDFNTTSDTYKTMYSTLIMEDGTVLYSTPGSSTDPGTNYGDAFADKSVFNNAINTFKTGELAYVSSDGFDEFFYPISIGNQTWASITGLETAELQVPVNRIRNTSLILAFFGILLLNIAAVIIIRRIIKPIIAVVESTQKLSVGDLNCKIDVVSDDEIGRLAIAFNTTVDSLKTIVEDIDFVLDELAANNFAVDVSKNYSGDFSSISDSLRKIVLALNKTLGGIKTAGNEVNSGSEQVSDAAMALSQGATEQASSIQELSATILDIYETVKQASNSAMEAKEKASETGNQVAISNEQMEQMTHAMTKITDKSNEIGKIIKTIEDIAFQTNILALNAAVEAARAGTAGKGFAVVADEVRNLASKSADAAKDTTALIEETINAVNEGSAITNRTANALSDVVELTNVTVDLVDKIAQATQNQELALGQVTQGIEQVSAVVQTNSATSEESAASAEELRSQANLLEELVSQFRLVDDQKNINPSNTSVKVSKHDYPSKPVMPKAKPAKKMETPKITEVKTPEKVEEKRVKPPVKKASVSDDFTNTNSKYEI